MTTNEPAPRPHVGSWSDRLPPAPIEYRVVLQRDMGVDDDICIHVRECSMVSTADSCDVPLDRAPALSAALVAGERERQAREIATGVGVCSCAEPKMLVPIGVIVADFTWYREGRPIESRHVVRVRLDLDALRAAVDTARPAGPVRTSAGELTAVSR